LRRIFLILAVAALVATTVFSAPAAFAGTKSHNHGLHRYVVCYKGNKYTFYENKQAQRDFLRYVGGHKGHC
jgi:hypothetical protein